MTPRWAAVHAVNLPAGAQTWISCGIDAAWSTEAQLSAMVFDALNIANWQRSGDAKAKPPTPLTRPSGVRENAVRAERHARRAQAFLERQQAVTAAEQDKPKTRPRDARGRFVKEG